MAKSRTFNNFLTGDEEEQLDKVEKYKEKVDWLIGQHETGEKGIKHFQCMFGWKNQKLLTTVKNYNLPHTETIQITEKPFNMLLYCTDETKRDKFTEVIRWGKIPDFKKSKNEFKDITADPVKDLLEAGGSKEDILKRAYEHNQTWYMNNHKKLKTLLDEKIPEPDLATYDIQLFNMKPIQFHAEKHVLLMGPTGVGKTQFALAHFKHPLLVKDKEDYRRFTDQTDGIVMDDIAFKTWLPETLLKLVDTLCTITQQVKYGSVRIPGKIKRIICVNNIDVFWPNGICDDHKRAIARRVDAYYAPKPLFGTSISVLKTFDLLQGISNQVEEAGEDVCDYCEGAHNSDYVCIARRRHIERFETPGEDV